MNNLEKFALACIFVPVVAVLAYLGVFLFQQFSWLGLFGYAVVVLFSWGISYLSTKWRQEAYEALFSSRPPEPPHE